MKAEARTLRDNWEKLAFLIQKGNADSPRVKAEIRARLEFQARYATAPTEKERKEVVEKIKWYGGGC